MNENDYGFTEVTGASYLRFNRVVIDNPLSGDVTVTGVKERIFNFDNTSISPDGVVQFEFNPEYEFDLLDPVTNLPIGKKMTMGELYMAISGCLQAKAKEVNNG